MLVFVCTAGGDLQLQQSTDPQMARQSSSQAGADSDSDATTQHQQNGHHGMAEGHPASAFATAQQQHVHRDPSGAAPHSSSGSSEAGPEAGRQLTRGSMQEQPHNRGQQQQQQQQVSGPSPTYSAAGLSLTGG